MNDSKISEADIEQLKQYCLKRIVELDRRLMVDLASQNPILGNPQYRVRKEYGFIPNQPKSIAIKD